MRAKSVIRLLAGASLLGSASAAIAQTSQGAAAAEPGLNAPAAALPPAQVEEPVAAPDALPQGSASGGDIVVTGSRVLRDGGNSPTPVTVVSAEQLSLAAPATITDGLNQLPAFRGSSRPQVAGAATGAVNNGGNYLNLRALGIQRTLVLLDGRRTPPTATTGATDVNLLPQILISRVDTVTGGASAAYGSDAVAGVVNFVLDNKFSGIRAEAQGGISDRGDNGSQKLALAVGKSFAEGRGHLLLSGEYFNSDPVFTYAERPWAQSRVALVPNTTGSGPSSLLATGVNLVIGSDGGKIVGVRGPTGTAIVGDPLTNFEFAQGGALDPFVAGTTRSTQFQVGGDGATQDSNLVAGLRRKTAFGRLSFEVAPDVTVFAEGTYGAARTRYKTLQPFAYNSSAININVGNPFIPADLQSIIDTRNTDAIATNNIGSIQIGRLNRDFGPTLYDVHSNTWRALGGFEGSFGGLTVDGYYSHSESRIRTAIENNLIYSRFAAALDAVRAPDGSIVCRAQPAGQPSTVPGSPAVGSPTCVPLNIFGAGAPSQAAVDYVTGSSISYLRYKQDIAALNVSGSPFATWAGDVNVGVGAEVRKEYASVDVDELSATTLNLTGLRGQTGGQGQLGNFQVGNPQPIAGGNTVKEAYAEVAVPLLRDSGAGHALDVNAAVRYADYTRGGGVTTWKVGAVYEPIEGLRARVTRSRDIRAANIGELFGVATQSLGTVRLPDGTVQSYITFGGGNPDLKPERADTFTAGLAFQPRFLPGFTATVDFYDIKIDGVIGSLSAQQTYDQCLAGSGQACGNIVFDPGRLIIYTRQLNLQRLQTRGVDAELGWRGDVAGGRLSARLLGGYLARYVLTAPGAAPFDYTGEVGQLYPNPKWQGVASINYDHGPFGLFVQERFIGSGTFDKRLVEGVTINDNSVPARFYTDATVRFRLEDTAGKPEFFMTVNNLFDRDPPLAPLQLGTITRPTNFLLYDVVGRYYTAGFRFRF